MNFETYTEEPAPIIEPTPEVTPQPVTLTNILAVGGTIGPNGYFDHPESGKVSPEKVILEKLGIPEPSNRGTETLIPVAGENDKATNDHNNAKGVYRTIENEQVKEKIAANSPGNGNQTSPFSGFENG